MKKNIDTERRVSINKRAHETDMTITDKLSVLFAGFQLSDIFSAQHHSDDFIDTRTQFILGRLKSVAIVFALLVPLSFAMDIFLLEEKLLSNMFFSRVILAISLVILAINCRMRNLSITLTVLVPLGFLLPSVFNIVTQIILNEQANTIAIAGYSYMPLLMVVMLALMPLTIFYSLTIIGIIFISTIGADLFLGQLFTSKSFNNIWAFFMFAGITLWLQTGQLVMLLKLYRESTLDPLTGLINRRVLMKRLEKEIAMKSDFFILMFDLDKFKKINDTFGHLDGDLVLKTMAQIIQQEIREKDIVARFGGEEFVAVLSGLSSEDAIAIAERARKTCEAAMITSSKGVNIQVTTSIGITQHNLSDSLEITFNRADEMLYQAKSTGRNNVVYG